LFHHIDKAIRYISYAENVNSVNKFLQEKPIKAAIEGATNEETFKAIETWLKRVANPFAGDKGEIDNFVNYIRQSASLYFLGLNPSVSAVQALSFFDTIDEISLLRALQGLKGFYVHPPTVHKFIMEKSSFMRSRYENGSFNRELNEFMGSRRIEILTQGKADLKQFYYVGITTVDYLTTMPTWLGAYQRGIKVYGNEDQAVKYADKVVRKTQPTGQIENLATMMSGSEAQKMFTQFMSYTSTHYNRLVDIPDKLFKRKDIPIPKKVLDSIVSFWWLVVPSAYLFAWIKSKFNKRKFDSRAVLFSTLKNLTGGLPLIRNIIQGIEWKRADMTPASLSGIKMVQDLFTKKKKYKTAASLIGFFSQLYPKKLVDILFSETGKKKGGSGSKFNKSKSKFNTKKSKFNKSKSKFNKTKSKFN